MKQLQDSVPTMRALIAEELQKERAELLSGIEQLLVRHEAGHEDVHLDASTTCETRVEAKPARAQQTIDSTPVHAEPKQNTTENGCTSALQGLEESPYDSLTQKKMADAKLEDVIQSGAKHTLTQNAALKDIPLAMPDFQLSTLALEEFRNHIIGRIVANPYFELIAAAAIMLNVVFMALEMQYNGFDTGYDIGAPNFTEPASEIWPHGETAFFVATVVFNTWFVIELLLRIGATGFQAIKSAWLWLDAFLIGCSLVEVTGVLGSAFNPSMLRMLRFLRMMRMLKLLKSSDVFESLLFFIKAIQESIGALIWTFVVLLCIQLAVGMLLHQLVNLFLQDSSNDVEARKRVFKYFGSFSKTMMTMFEITMANWVTTCRLLMDDVNEWFGLFYVLYRCCFCFGVLKVITAVFIGQVHMAMARDDDLVTMVKEKERTLFRKKLEEMFDGLDTNLDGYMTWSEFEVITQNQRWRSWADKLGIPMSDVEGLFEMLAGSDGRVSFKEFSYGIQRVKGPAKSVDMVWLLSQFGQMLESNRIIETRMLESDMHLMQRKELPDSMMVDRSASWKSI
jgi:hypothetical protein